MLIYNMIKHPNDDIMDQMNVYQFKFDLEFPRENILKPDKALMMSMPRSNIQ